MNLQMAHIIVSITGIKMLKALERKTTHTKQGLNN